MGFHEGELVSHVSVLVNVNVNVPPQENAASLSSVPHSSSSAKRMSGSPCLPRFCAPCFLSR